MKGCTFFSIYCAPWERLLPWDFCVYNEALSPPCELVDLMIGEQASAQLTIVLSPSNTMSELSLQPMPASGIPIRPNSLVHLFFSEAVRPYSGSVNIGLHGVIGDRKMGFKLIETRAEVVTIDHSHEEWVLITCGDESQWTLPLKTGEGPLESIHVAKIEQSGSEDACPILYSAHGATDFCPGAPPHCLSVKLLQEKRKPRRRVPSHTRISRESSESSAPTTQTSTATNGSSSRCTPM